MVEYPALGETAAPDTLIAQPSLSRRRSLLFRENQDQVLRHYRSRAA